MITMKNTKKSKREILGGEGGLDTVDFLHKTADEWTSDNYPRH